MSSGEGVDAASQRKRNYKLLVDPELDQSATKKVYRFNGVLVGYKPIPDPTDPRIQKTVLGSVKPCLDLVVPRFKYDKFSVTAPPRTDVLLLGISETAQGDLLKNLLVSEIGPTYFIKYHRHPKTNAFLGAASVSFKKNGHGRLAEELLDGRMLCGRHIKVQLDDKGDKAREFLRDVVEGGVKKTGNDIVVEGSIRRLSSTSSQKAEDVVNDPKESLDMTSDGSPNSSGHKLYPLSVLNINAGSVTPLYDTPSSVTNTCSVPPTPSSLDSGLSLTMPKQQDNVAIDKPKHLFSHSTLSCLPMALINNKQTAISPPPMNTNSITALAAKINPPLPATDVKPPPLPSIPPNDIDNISISPISMEGEVPDGGGGSKGESRTVVDMVSPISTSPVDSLTEYDATLRAEVSKEPPTLFPTQFDPRLGLKGLLNMTSSVTTPAPPSVDLMPVSPPEYNDPAITVVSPPVASLEVEEISGDESPEMVYMYPSDRTSKGETAGPKESYKVKVEQLSSDDMEMASDEENTVIEVNPTSVAKQCSPPLPANHMMPYMECQMPPPHPPPMPHPPSHMFPPHPASMPLPLPFKPPPPPYFDPTAGAPPFHHRPPLPPHHHNHHHQQHMGPHPPFHPYDSGGPYRPPMYHPHLSKDSMKRPLGSLGGKELLEEMKKEVMMVVCQQLRDVLLRDMRKSLVETSAFASLDTFWERREKMKLERLQNRTNRINEPSSVPAKEAPPTISKDSQPSASKENDPSAAVIAAEAAAVNAEPYRQLLPDQAEEEVAPQQPRKRLLNFKIPLLNRGSHRRNQGVSLVTRRKVSRPHSPAGPPQQTVSRRKRKPSVDSYSDISSVSSSGESDAYVEEDEEGDISSPPRLARHTTSKIVETESEEEESDDDSDIYEQLRNARKLSVNSVYSDRESSEEDMDEEEEPLQQKVVPSPPQPVPVHTDHIYAKPPKTPEAQNDNDDIVVEINEEEEKRRREELLTAQARQHSFPVRSAEREDEILHQFHNNYGPDKEDVEMLKQALKRLKEQKNELVDGVPWAYYPSVPPESIPLPSKRRKTTHHVTGSARTEGYYKIDPMEKKAYLRHSLPSFATPTPRNKASKKEESLSRSRSNRAAHRRLASVFSTGDASSDIHKFNQLKARKKQLKFSKSRIHGWGLFAMENIAADEMVIEYVGEVIRSSVADEREKRYEAAGIGSSYLFRMDMDYVIDATKKGSLARFINHCCDPNCYAKVINFGFQKKIVIYSKRDIKATEEITYDYKFPIEEEKIPCLCGAPNCRGTLN